MSGEHGFIQTSIREKKALALRMQVTQLRRCLCCEFWMHSTGPDHRICTPRKGELGSKGSPVGRRVNVAGLRKGVTS